MVNYSARYEKSYALAVGIDLYQHDAALPPLQTARNGAAAVADLLLNQFNFDEVITLFDADASKSAIEDAIASLRSNTSDDDRLVVYFAGHGIGLKGTVRTEGWLAAYDSDHTRHYRLLRMADLADPNYTRAKHVLAIIDACHSGMALTYEAPRAPAAPRDRQRALEHFLTRRAYQVLSSANSLETASDAPLLEGHTPFTGYLINALSGDDPAVRDSVTGLTTSDSVARYIRSSMAANFRSWQGPQAGILPGDGGGVLVWQIPSLIETLPSRLARALQSEDPDTRYYAIAEAATLASDPQHGSTIQEVLRDMVTNDPDPDVRRRAYDMVRHFSPITEDHPEPEQIIVTPPEPQVITPEPMLEHSRPPAAEPRLQPETVTQPEPGPVHVGQVRKLEAEKRLAPTRRNLWAALAVTLVSWTTIAITRLSWNIEPLLIGDYDRRIVIYGDYLVVGIFTGFTLLLAIRLLAPMIKLQTILVASLLWGITMGLWGDVLYQSALSSSGSFNANVPMRTVTLAVMDSMIICLVLTLHAVRGWRRQLTWLVVSWAAITLVTSAVPVSSYDDYASDNLVLGLMHSWVLATLSLFLVYRLRRITVHEMPPSESFQNRAPRAWVNIFLTSGLGIIVITFISAPWAISGPSFRVNVEKPFLTALTALAGPIGGFLIGALSGKAWSFYDPIPLGLGGIVLGVGYNRFVWQLGEKRLRRTINWILLLIGYFIVVQVLFGSVVYGLLAWRSFDLFWQEVGGYFRILLPTIIVTTMITSAWVAFAPDNLRRPLWIED